MSPRQAESGRRRDVLSLVGGDQIIFDRPLSLSRRSYELIVGYIELMEAAWITEEAVPDSDDESIPPEDEPLEPKITNEKPLSLYPLGFEEAVGALLETAPMPPERSQPKPKRKYKRPISLAHLTPEEAIKRAMAVPYKAKQKRKKEEEGVGPKVGAVAQEESEESTVIADKPTDLIWENSGVIRLADEPLETAGLAEDNQWEEDDEGDSEDHESEGYDYDGRTDEIGENDEDQLTREEFFRVLGKVARPDP